LELVNDEKNQIDQELVVNICSINKMRQEKEARR
jgi:hypothetical protein